MLVFMPALHRRQEILELSVIPELELDLLVRELNILCLDLDCAVVFVALAGFLGDGRVASKLPLE